MPKLAKKIAVMATFMAVVTGLFTASMTFFARNAGDPFLATWLPTWTLVALLVAPIGFGLFLVVGKAMERLLPNGPNGLRLVLQGLIMGLSMESLMATIATYQINGFASGYEVIWIKALLAGLPLAALMSVLGTFFIKPRMDAFLAS